MTCEKSDENSLLTLNNDMIRASYKLSVNEIRLILIAIAQMPKGEAGQVLEPLDPMKPYYIKKEDFVRLGVDPTNVAREIRSACSDLLDRKVFIDTPIGVLGTHWVHNILHFKTDIFEELKQKYPDSKYDDDFIQQLRKHNLLDSLPLIAKSDDNVMARVIFHADIIPYISELRQHFTQLKLNEMAGFSSFYSFRVYMIMMQWRSTGVVMCTLADFREMLDLTDKYAAVKDLRKRVLDVAIDEINEKSNYTASYSLTDKNGNSGKGFKLTHLKIKFKPKAKTVKGETKNEAERDQNTADMFTVDGLNDKQLGRIARNPTFMAEYNHLVSPTSPAGQSQQGWEFEMINRLKKDPKQFSKRPIKEYLDY